MRHSLPVLSISVLLLTLGVSFAQPPRQPGVGIQPPQANSNDPNARRLDQLLANWEREMSSLQTMAAEVERTVTVKAFNNKETMTGTVKFDRPDLARLDLVDPQDRERYEQFICTGTAVYVVRPNEKAVYVAQLPPRQNGQLPDEGPMQFLFGMKADTAKRRYNLKVTSQDQYYTYVYVDPKFPADKRDFEKARLVILNQTGLPVRLDLKEPNGNEVTWNIGRVQKNVNIPRTEFAAPRLPSGWQFKQVQQNQPAPPARPAAQPRIIRPQTQRLFPRE